MKETTGSVPVSMASPDSVRVLEVCQVAAASGSPESATALSLPITFLDARYFKFPPAERIYFFKLHGSTPTFFHSVLVPTLKHSLSQTLRHFLPLAGHLTWPPHSPKPIILYSPNDAVSLTIAESDADLDRLVGDEIREASESRLCVPELPISDTKASVIALQITLFLNKGYSISIAMHHAVVDGKTASMFLKAWAHLCKNTAKGQTFTLSPELTPSFDRSTIKDPDELESFYLNHWVATTKLDSKSNPRSLKLLPNLLGVPPKLVRATFQLSRENIEKLREAVVSYHQHGAAGLQPTREVRLSTFVLTCAYLSVCLVKARGGDANRMVYFLVAADCRSRLDPPISQNYFGNGVFVHDTVIEARTFMEENGVAIIAEKISGIIKGLEKGLFRGAKESHERLRSTGADVQKIGIAGSPRFLYYEEDFGWGKPNKVEIASIDRIHGVSLMESRDGNGGIEIGIVMRRHEMEAFASLFVQGLN